MEGTRRMSVSRLVTVERRGHVAMAVMNRAEKRNAINPSLAEALDAALDALDDGPKVRATVLAGSGGAVSAGTDLVEGSGTPSERGGEYGVIRRRRRTPLIAAVEGVALGGGLEIALACDLVVASTTATFGLPEVR